MRLPFFGQKKETERSLAEVVGDGPAVFAEEMKKKKYNDYAGKEPVLEIDVLVKPVGQPPFTSRLRFGMTRHLLLRPGVVVYVKHAIDGAKTVTLDDLDAEVLERNAALLKKT